nr:hypothetical protein [uncultured Acetatifactor sp.]
MKQRIDEEAGERPAAKRRLWKWERTSMTKHESSILAQDERWRRA